MYKNAPIPLLQEQSTPGACGVDLPEIPQTSVRTGLPVREKIGLPEVSEPAVVRYFTQLSQLNYAIDTHMYPLGSCTMKHNPRLNEKLARLPGFSDIHPLQPVGTVQGMLTLIGQLQDWLSALTGLPCISLLPAAGAHGELTGMMLVAKALKKRGETRKIVLVPDSAHGTNPATAATCGFTPVEIPSTSSGLVDMQAFEAACTKHGRTIAAFMLTNPNTCGLFEPNVKVIADKLHDLGAFFYCDGANFNAIMGKVRPADIGLDVMQFNLHKTFSTPHGGGGPGCGPVAVCAELGPYLPIPRVKREEDGGDEEDRFTLEEDAPESIGRIRGFNGQIGMMVRALAYMLSHGGDGLKKVAEDAVLNANYIFHHLKDDFNAPFQAAGPCMHECLLNDKHTRSSVHTLDYAKALIDKGFHPMTIYFPLVVGGAMLIEPTETESKQTLDAFIATMKALAAQARSEPETFKQAPQNAPRTRLDETTAAKKPVLNTQELLGGVEV